jgi:2-hydroxy-6-oxonona-2,4-dienedioate hydrolase
MKVTSKPPSKRALLLSALAVGTAAAVIARQHALRKIRGPKEPKGSLRDLWTEVEGLRIYARVSRGPVAGLLPIVLVHGYGMSSSYMVPIAERLAAERPVFALDLPGHGRSEAPERILDIPELAEILDAWMDAVGLHRVAFLANSMGCQVVAELAVRHPERVDRLILTAPTTDPEARTFQQHLQRFLLTSSAERQSLNFLLLRDYSRAGLLRLRRQMEVVFADRIEDKLPRISAPALVVRGEHDHVVPQQWAEEVARRLGAGEVRVIPGTGHAPNYSAADQLMRVIRPFLRAERPERATG